MNLRRRTRKRVERSGFTLVEILVVMAIMAMLVSWLASATMNVRERATRTVCTSNLRQLIQAARMYESDNDHLPIHYNTNVVPNRAAHWQEQVWPYIRDRRVFICPHDPDAGTTGGGAGGHTEGGWPYSYPYYLNDFWLTPDGSYRPPSARSPLFTDGFHTTATGAPGTTKPGGIILIGRYDGSVEAAPPFKYEVIGYEPEDGKGMLR